MKYDELRGSFTRIIGNRDFQIFFTAILFIIILLMSSSIRLSNWDSLTDSTTGEKIPLALDPYYFLRVAETLVANDGVLPQYDTFRGGALSTTAWHPEIMPRVVVQLWKFANVFGDYTIQAIDVFSPVLFYFFGLIAFFFLVYSLTKSKAASLIASALLAFSPAYLYRTMAGFSDHESIGMLTFFLALLVYSLVLKYLVILKKKSWLIGIFGVVVGFLTILTLASWGGVANFLLLIIPMSFGLVWLFNTRRGKEDFFITGLLFYFSWIVFSFLFGLLFNYKVKTVLNFFMGSLGIFSMAVFLFVLLDSLFIYFKPSFIRKGFRILYSFVASIIIGAIGLAVIGRNPFILMVQVVNRFISPFSGGDRLGATVAENAAPYLSTWMGNVGAPVFWLFVFGVVLFGFVVSRNIKILKNSISFFFLYCLMVFGIVFSKISPTSVLNGEGFLSYAFYFVPLIVFGIYFVKIYLEGSFGWSAEDCLIFALMVFTIVSGRAAARVFFVITPFMAFFAAYFVMKILELRGRTKEEISKMLLTVLFIIGLLACLFSINAGYVSTANQAQYTGPSAGVQWQGAMEWVRNNTAESALFSHWWDYGYWIETLGQRATIADGGHFQGEYGNNKVGRYILTTPNPESAFSFFKSRGITHLLIDPTDLGKYSAYSKIGSGKDSWDRFSYIPTGVYDPKQVQETANGTGYIYNIQGGVDEDIEYNQGNVSVFLPGFTFDKEGNPSAKSYLAGILLKIEEDRLTQPTAVYIYNGQQYRLLMRYVYANGQLFDFKTGVDAVFRLVPNLENGQINPFGAGIYLSPMVKDSLFAQLYLLEDSFGNYEEVNLVHEEDDPFVTSIKSQGFDIDSLVYYQGIRGPIKIWETGYPTDTEVHEEFDFLIEGEDYGMLDKYFY